MSQGETPSSQTVTVQISKTFQKFSILDIGCMYISSNFPSSIHFSFAISYLLLFNGSIVC